MLLGGQSYSIEISWRIKKSILLQAPVKKVIDVKKDKTGVLIEYQIEGLGWKSKEEAIALARKKEIDAIVVKSSRGKPYLRSRPDGESNFLEMV
ncbi:DUF3892 domain-containing protein [Deltaproteobacteria bacterium TL4]